MNRNGSGGAFHPFKKEKATPPPVNRSVPPASTSSSAETGGGGGGSKKVESAERKARRCWSAELHRKFLQALQQLGGSHRMFQNLLINYYYIIIIHDFIS